MKRVVLIADSGLALEAMTAGVMATSSLYIVRHCYGRSPLGRGFARFAPHIVLVDEMGWPTLALQRIDEIRETLPQARIVVRAARPEAGWLAEALRAGARAVVPATAGAETLGLVLSEVVSERELEVHAESAAVAA